MKFTQKVRADPTVHELHVAVQGHEHDTTKQVGYRQMDNEKFDQIIVAKRLLVDDEDERVADDADQTGKEML